MKKKYEPIKVKGWNNHIVESCHEIIYCKKQFSCDVLRDAIKGNIDSFKNKMYEHGMWVADKHPRSDPLHMRFIVTARTTNYGDISERSARYALNELFKRNIVKFKQN